ncbi:hypothetical protein [Alienimonas californiensis]|uniref:DUF4350 domain-containing protein n=1 Tax=Alienimonas californiensis TaxID=2527989 RepID=A0A517PED3_9PLAN|nr:hypothetical protein [Alienimonas californiensis]QDT17733.1 hypothetical protein CA12_38650 [Alienimonas californiensis]
MTSRGFALLLIAALTLCRAAPAPAQSGSESRSSSDDLECEFDDRWVGGTRGGYWPVRVRVTNRGAARAITVAFLPYESRRGGGRAMTVTRTLALPAGAATRFTLPVPLTAARGDGEVVVLADPLPEDGAVSADPRDPDDLLDAAVPGLIHEVHPPRSDLNAIHPPATLVIAGATADERAFRRVSWATTAAIEADSSRARERRTSGGGRGESLTLPPEALPETWLGFTTVDVIVADAPRLAALSDGARQAVRDWVAAGGTLTVMDAMTNPADPLPAAALGALGLDDDLQGWTATAADGDGTRSEPEFDPSPFRSPEFRAFDGDVRPFDGDGRQSRRRFEQEAEESGREAWRRPGPPVGLAPRRLNVAGGRVYAFAAGADGVSDWYAVFQDLGPDRLNVADRFGVGARGPNAEFIEFLIPGVRGVPVGTLVALITLFVVVIGPVNYLVLRRRHQVGRLALTVPLIAAATAGTLLAYSTLMHGFGAKARQFAVTVHDADQDRAVEWARTAVFASQSPDGGLIFPAETAVLPLAPPGPSVGGGRVDWTSGQAWSGDAFRSRTRTQFVTVSPRPERGRLTIEWANGRPTAVNGYERDFALIALSDEKGRVYHGADLPAGGALRLRPITGDDLFLWRETLDERLPQAPPGMEKDQDDLLSEFPMLHSDPDTNASFKASLAYRTAASVRGLNEHSEPIDAFEEAPLAPAARGTFVALLAEPALTEFGGQSVDARGGTHLLIGRPVSADGEAPTAAPATADRATAGGAIGVRRPGGGR